MYLSGQKQSRRETTQRLCMLLWLHLGSYIMHLGIVYIDK